MTTIETEPVRSRTTTTPRQAKALAAPAASPLRSFDVEAIRVTHERAFAAEVESHPLFAQIALRLRRPDAKDERRRLMAASLRLSEAMAPDAHRVAHEAQRILGVSGTLELYQRSGPENAAMHRVEDPILLEIHGSLLPRLDPGALLALFGHELGHYLAHGPTGPNQAASRIPLGLIDDRSMVVPLSRLSMMCELTADRIALLACQDLSSLLRLMLVTVSGLAVGELTYDTEVYLAQCKELIEEDLRAGAIAKHDTHPEHGLRVYAAWLFSETRVYRELTGRGPGTRELAEVDEIIARCFGASDKVIHDPVQAGDVPREFLECALAAAVMVAMADGSLSSDELLLIEQVFASEISDWQTYLEPELARARFLETSVVLSSSIHELGPPLLNLLFDIMIADREIDPAELQMVLEIGRALGVGAQFARALGAMLRQKGVSLDLAELKPLEEPLTAKRGDVEDALQTFLSGVLRRGESTLTLRRMLRLLGSESRTEELLARLTQAFAHHRIAVAPLLAETLDLDAHLVLTPPAPAAPPTAAAPLSGSKASLIAALRRLREQLVSGDGRSPSVRLREPRRGRAFDLMTLDRISVGSAERVMTQVRARRGVQLVEAGDAGRHGPASVAATDLLALAREDSQRTDETGARDLYVGYPFLTGIVAGYLVRAPLVLYPVELQRNGDGARGFRLEARKDEPPVANQSLIRLIFNKRGFSFSDELSDELEALAGAPDGGPEAVRQHLAKQGLVAADGAATLQPLRLVEEEALSEDRGLALEESAVLGLFPQSSSDLLQDYDGLLQALAKPDADLGALLAAASTLLPEALVASASPPSTSATTTDWVPVIPADPSQRSVIAEARRHGATVIDGPPGTGKSQVIVNLVAEALRRGERVAVVCEKRAALDVVKQRMTAIGFGKALAVVHDVHEDRKPLFAHIAGRLENAGRIPFSAAESARALEAHTQVRQALARRAEALQAIPAGLELSVAELLAFTAQGGAPQLPTTAGLERLAQAELRTLLDVTVALAPLVALWSPSSPWRAGPPGSARRSLASSGLSKLRDLEVALERAVETARAFERQSAQGPAGVTVETLEEARPALEIAVASRSLRGDDRDRVLFGTIAQLVATEPERLRDAGQARQAWETEQAALLRIERPISVDAGPELAASLSILTHRGKSWTRVLSRAWWRARTQVRAELTRLWPERAGAALTPALLAEVGDQLAASRAWRSIREVFTRLGLDQLVPDKAPLLPQVIEKVTSMAERLRELGTSRPALLAAGAWLPEGPATVASLAAWDTSLDARLATLAARSALLAEVAELRPWFPFLPAVPTADALDQLLVAWRRDAFALHEVDGLFAKLDAALPAAARLFDAIAQSWGELSALDWRAGVAAAWATAWLTRLERAQSSLASLGQGADDREIERLTARLGELETERRELEIERTLAQLDEAKLLTIDAATKSQRRTAEQKLREELLKEVRKQRMLMPLRTFVRRFAPAGLLDVTPVWLLSPETMAILFPRLPLFDLVVFDEASQCTVEAGLPVLLRAKRVVIAGDEKQMPPSSYFSLGGAEDDESLAGTTEADERKDVLRDLLTAESLLSLARPRVAHTGLSWHYRCHDEALIAFSNHAMYQGELFTIPSISGTAAPSALHWVSVVGGVYDAGENRPEAQRVVEVVDELLARTPRPTVGVVTFNLKQRKAVLDAVDTRCAEDEAFRARWAEAAALPLDERPFVRNLEQVQGDERDIIVFSLGHAPQVRHRGGVATGESYVPARFGPLGQRGGERRLNVAISRAKAACYVVASFEPGQLTVATSKHQGPRLFKHFLEFAHFHHHGHRLDAARVLELVRGKTRAGETSRQRLPIEGFVSLQAQLTLALEAAGIPYEPNVGASGFRIPLAILDPSDPTRFALALLLQDGGGPTDPFDLYIHRPGTLRQRGWKVLVVSVASWQRRRAELLDELEQLVPGCRGAAHSELYQRHRTASSSARERSPASRALPARSVASPPSAAEAPPGEAGSVAAPAPRRESAPVPAIPAWALAISDELFRSALLHLERHGVLSEHELTSLVGGPRRARLFARELDGWLPDLPFQIEISMIGGAKSYRKGAPT